MRPLFRSIALIAFLVSVSADPAPPIAERTALAEAKPVAISTAINIDALREEAKSALARLQQSHNARVITVNHAGF